MAHRNLQVAGTAGDHEHLTRSALRIGAQQRVGLDGPDGHGKVPGFEIREIVHMKVGDDVAKPVDLQNAAQPGVLAGALRLLETGPEVVGDDLADAMLGL